VIPVATTTPSPSAPLPRSQLVAILRAVDDSRLAAQSAARGYRNALAVASVVLSVVMVLFPLLAGPAGRALATGDYAEVEVWGAVGGLVGAVGGLRQLRPGRRPMGLQIAQLVLKVPAGALLAVFGVVLLQSGIVPVLPPSADGRLAAYAVLFGFAQEALTRAVDRQARQLLDQARPLSSRSASSTGAAATGA
jgi:hypothetical protein